MLPKREVLICDIQRFSVHDGPGIRTTIFFKGCPLACRWCHNPEAIGFGNEIVYSAEKCVSCGECVKACDDSAIEMSGPVVTIARSRCDLCMKCADACPTGALSPAGRGYDAEELLAEVLCDKDYYGGDGGITLSGGEPLIHHEFLMPFLARAKEAELHVVAETAGHVPAEGMNELADLIDLFLFDLKCADPVRHQELTGKDNALIQRNLRTLVAQGRSVEVRMPVIPGLTDAREDLEQVGRFLTSIGVSAIVLLPYHKLGDNKLAKVRAPYEPIVSNPPSPEEMQAAIECFEAGDVKAIVAL